LERKLAVALIFTGGVSLVLDFSCTVGIISQLLWLGLQLLPLRDGASLYEIQWVFINALILVILLKSKCETSCKSNSVQPKPAKIEPSPHVSTRVNPDN